MKKIAQDLVCAFHEGRTAHVGNSSVTVNDPVADPGVATFRLHGHMIVTAHPDGAVRVSLAGWPTPTTRSRINDICLALTGKRAVWQQKHEQWGDPWGLPPRPIDSREWFTVGYIA